MNLLFFPYPIPDYNLDKKDQFLYDDSKPNTPNTPNKPDKPKPDTPNKPDKKPDKPSPDNSKPNEPDDKKDDNNDNSNNGGSGDDFGTSNGAIVKPGGTTTETNDDNKSNNSDNNKKNDNSGNINNGDANSSLNGDANRGNGEYKGQLDNIIDTLKKIENNTKDNDLSKFFKDDGSLEKFKKNNPFDSYDKDDNLLDALNPKKITDDFFNKFDPLSKELDKLKNDDMTTKLPALKNVSSVGSCPISVNFNNGPINKLITWDLCKVLYPYRDVFYPLFMLIFMSIFVPLTFKMFSSIIKGA